MTILVNIQHSIVLFKPNKVIFNLMVYFQKSNRSMGHYKNVLEKFKEVRAGQYIMKLKSYFFYAKLDFYMN